MKNTGKLFLIINLISSIYFIFLALDTYYFKIHSIMLGMIREMITLPIIGAQYILTIAALVFWIKSKFSFPSYMFFALIVSLCNIIPTLSIWL